jgi:hypothetical protein
LVRYQTGRTFTCIARRLPLRPSPRADQWVT